MNHRSSESFSASELAEARRGQVRIERGIPYADPDRTLSLLPAAAQGEWMASNRDAFAGDLLDLGCGNQPYRTWYESLATTCVAYDVAATPGVDVVGVAELLPFRDQAFDTVFATEVLEHVDNAEQAVAEIARVLRPGGIALVTVPFIYPVHEAPHDHRRFTQFGLVALMERNGLSVVNIQAKGGLLVLAGHWAMLTGLATAASLGARLGRPFDPARPSLIRTGLVTLQTAVIRRGVSKDVVGSAAWASLGFMVRAERVSAQTQTSHG